MAAASSRHIEPLLPLVTLVSGTDSGTGTDAQVLTAAYTSVDTGSGADTAGILLVSSDTGVGRGEDNPRVGIVAADTGSGSDTGTQSSAFTDTDTGAGTEASVEAPHPTAELGVGADTETLSVAVSSADQNRTSRTELDTAAGVDTIGSQTRSDGDTASGVDSIVGQAFQLADIGAAAEQQVLSKVDTSADAGSGADTEQVSSQKFTSTDTGSGAEAQTRRRFIVDVDSGRGETDFTTPVDLDASGTAVDVAVVTGFPAADAGAGADTQSLSISIGTSLSDTDAGYSYDGNIDTATAGPLWWWGAELSAVTVTPAAETNTAVEVEALRAIQVAASETGAGDDTVATVSTTGVDQLLNAFDTGSGDDEAISIPNGIIGDSDTATAVEEVSDRTLGDQDATGAGVETENLQPLDDDGGDFASGDDEENVAPQADRDIAFGADEESLTLTDTDTAAANEATSPAPPADRDVFTATETVGALAQVTGDTATAFELTNLRAVQTLSAQDFGFGTDVEHVYITLVDTGTASEATAGRSIATQDGNTATETTVLVVAGLLDTDTGRGRSFGTVSLPVFVDVGGTLVMAKDTVGGLAFTSDTAGSLSMSTDQLGGSSLPPGVQVGPGQMPRTMTPDTPGSLKLVPIGDTQE